MTDPRRLRIEAVILAAIACTPLVSYLVSLARHPLGRFAVEGDYAGLEIATRYVFTGRTLLGPYSRFGFNHPGPMYFFVIAPIYVLLGRTSTALWACAVLVNAAAVATTVIAVRLFATRPHAIAAAVTIAAWLAAFGDACPQPWNPMVVVLPLLAFLVCAAQVARGQSAMVAATLFFGVLAAETHLSTVTTVAGVLVVAGLAFVRAARRRGGFTRSDRRAIALGAVVCVLGALPVAIEQLTSPVGNLTKIIAFFRHAKHTARLPAFMHWVDGASWLPARLIHWTLATEQGPQIMASSAVSDVASPFAVRMAILWLVAVAVASAVAIRRRDDASLALLGMGVLASVLAIIALRSVVGETMYYLVFWTSAGTTTAWMGVATTFAAALASHAKRLVHIPAARIAAIAAPMLAAALATEANWRWITRQNLRWAGARDAGDAYGALVARLRDTHETPVIHVQGAWNLSLLLLNELTRDGVEPRVEWSERWILGRQFETPDDAPRPLHVYTRSDFQPLGTADCLTPLIDNHTIAIFVSKSEVTACPPP